MANMTILEAAEHFGVSKEAIHNRVRRGSLEVVVVDGVKLVTIDALAPTKKPQTQARRKANTTTQVNDDRYYKLLEEQNTQLQAKVEKFEQEVSNLRDQKENMLIEERIKIEQIYRDKDEQLKSILHTLSSELMLKPPVVEKEEHLEAEIEEPKKNSELISLKKYLKSQKISQKKIEKIKARFKKRAKKDDKIIILSDKYYVDILKYDYKDLIK